MSEKLTKNERRAQAREQARRMQEERRRRERIRRGLTIGGIILGAVAIVAVVALVIVNSIRPPGPGPENMASNGIVIGEGFQAVRTPATPADAVLTPTEPRDDVMQIIVYNDYMCAGCAAFEQANQELLEQLIESGAATVEIHPIAILDQSSLGSRYSSRAASAAACVAEYAPDQFWGFNSAMFENQPQQGTTGLTNDELVAVAESTGIDVSTGLGDCIREGRFTDWVENATIIAGSEPVPGTDGVMVNSTPTVIVDGQQYEGLPGDAAAFEAFVMAAAGQLPGDAPAEGEAPAESEAPAEGEAPTETEAPADGEAPAEPSPSEG